MRLGLQESEVREVLARAEEIRQQEQIPLDLNEYASELLTAAEEAGLSRSALTQALRERLATMRTPLEPGAIVLAETTPGKLYAAEVLDIADAHVKVRFLSGMEANLSIEDIQPFNLFPGQKVRCPWPDWGWWTCSVLSYDHERRLLTVTDNWGETETFKLSEVYVDKKREPGTGAISRRQTMWLAIGATAAGGLIGALITWFVLRG